MLATLIRLLGDFDRAEEALHDAFAAAVEQWPREGVPANPRAWLVSTGRFKAIDALRRRARFDASLGELARRIEATEGPAQAGRPGEIEGGHPDSLIEDDRLRLIFTCCHPALPPDAQIALTLREVCGLSTEEIARAYLVAPSTLAQRIVRAKNKIREAGIPYQVPSAAELPERLDAVLHVIYLVFNEGYSASAGDSVTRADLSAEAIRLGRLLVDLGGSAAQDPPYGCEAPQDPPYGCEAAQDPPDGCEAAQDPPCGWEEAIGLLALMLLQDSRRDARTTADGELILLEDQDRTRWNREQIVEGLRLVERALATRRIGPYTLQAAIAAVHASAGSAADTDWAEIAAMYDVLLRVDPSPVVELNRAVAIAMRDGPAAGLALVDALLGRGELADYPLAHSARGELCRRLGRIGDARTAYERALVLTRQEPQRRFLNNRLNDLPESSTAN